MSMCDKRARMSMCDKRWSHNTLAGVVFCLGVSGGWV